MSAHSPTIADIAKALGVTPSTVSRALQGHPRISVRTKHAVQAMAEKLNYQPNQMAAGLRKGRSRLLGVVVPLFNMNFFSNVIYGIEQVAHEHGYSVIICQSNDQQSKEATIVQAQIQTPVAGVIAALARETQDFSHYQHILDQKIPLVLFDRITDRFGVSTVAIDDHLGGYRATQHLIKQGCTRIAHLGGLSRLNIYRDRLRGYQDALRDYGLPERSEHVLYPIRNQHDIAHGYQAMAELWQRSPQPDGIFSASDHAAVGAIKYLKEQGVSVPEQVAIVGFANEPFTELVEPGISSVDQCSQSMGQAAAEILMGQLRDADTPVQKSVLTPRLIIRASSLRLGSSSGDLPK